MAPHPDVRRQAVARLGVLVLVATTLLCPTLARAQESRRPARPPNILLVVADGHGQQAISAYGSPLARTPAIDRLAKEGMVFLHCLAPDTACGTGDAAILTGTYGGRSGVRRAGDRLDPRAPTFPSLLRQAGYQTAVVGKWELRGEPIGFDHWEVLAGPVTYYNPTFLTPKGRAAASGYATDLITDKALAWLGAGRDAAKPFCLVVRHLAPGRPWDAGPEQLTMYMDAILPQPRTLLDGPAARGGAARARQRMATVARDLNDRDLKLKPPENLTPEQRASWDAVYGPENVFLRRSNPRGQDLVRWKYQRCLKAYLCSAAAVDDGVRRLLEYLDQNKLTNDTVVVYTSDHGTFLGEHGCVGTGWMDEEPLTTPLLVRWPGAVKPASQNADLVSTLDLAPTLLDLAGVRAPDAVQGQSLVPLLKGQRIAGWREHFYFRTEGGGDVPPHEGVRTARHKLIHFAEGDEWELFDLGKDPQELQSVFADPAYAGTLAQLKAELTRLRALYAGVAGE